MSNVQYLYDFIKYYNLFNAKVKAVVVTGFDKDLGRHRCVTGHLVITYGYDEKVIDPSYDVVSLDDKSYFHNIKDLKENTGFNYQQFKNIINDVVDFTKKADRMNNGECVCADLKFYNDQADFIEKCMVLKRISRI
jgi:hypothetical protein